MPPGPGRTIPRRALPAVSPPLLSADGTHPHHLAGRGVEVGFDDARAPFPSDTPPAFHWRKPGFRPRRRGGNGDDARRPFGQPPGGVRREGDQSLRRQKMGEVGDPGLGRVGPSARARSSPPNRVDEERGYGFMARIIWRPYLICGSPGQVAIAPACDRSHASLRNAIGERPPTRIAGPQR